MEHKNHNQQINCSVESCIYNQTDVQGCNLNTIKVCPNCQKKKITTDEKNPSACGNFECK